VCSGVQNVEFDNMDNLAETPFGNSSTEYDFVQNLNSARDATTLRNIHVHRGSFNIIFT